MFSNGNISGKVFAAPSLAPLCKNQPVFYLKSLKIKKMLRKNKKLISFLLNKLITKRLSNFVNCAMKRMEKGKKREKLTNTFFEVRMHFICCKSGSSNVTCEKY